MNAEIMQAAMWPKRTMTWREAMAWSKKLNDAGHTTDGCTYSPDFKQEFREVCAMHDRLREFLPVPVSDGDKLFRQAGYYGVGGKYKVVAWVYWAFVRVSYITGIYR